MDLDTPWWTVVGCWPTSKERWMGHYQALTPRTAEDMARMDAEAAWQAAGMPGRVEFWVCGVFAGQHQQADNYARFVDPDMIAESDL